MPRRSRGSKLTKVIEHEIDGAVTALSKRRRGGALRHDTHARLRAGVGGAPLRGAAGFLSSATLRRSASMRLIARRGAASVCLCSLALLCARRQRPRRRSAAEQRYELASLHSITSSARASSVTRRTPRLLPGSTRSRHACGIAHASAQSYCRAIFRSLPPFFGASPPLYKARKFAILERPTEWPWNTKVLASAIKAHPTALELPQLCIDLRRLL